MLLRSNYSTRSIGIKYIRRLCTPPPIQPPPWYRVWWEKYERWLENKYPRAYKYHRLFTDGSIHCYNDSKIFFRVSSEMNKGKQLKDFTRQDLEIYMLTSRDLVRVVFILIFMWMPPPIAELYFLLMICYPRVLLTRHFWTPHQNEKFRAIFFQKQNQHRTKIIESLMAELEKRKNETGAADLIKLFNASKSTSQAPLSLSDLRHYASTISTIGIDQLPFVHQFHLLSAHGMWPGMPFYTSRLHQRAELIQAIDAKLAGENIDHLPLSDLAQSLNVRKLNDIGLSEDEKRQLLKQWITLAKSNSSSSFILHAVILGSFK